MPKRTTIELAVELLARVRRVWGAQAPEEESRRREAEQAKDERRTAEQLRYLRRLRGPVDLDVLGAEEMWR